VIWWTLVALVVLAPLPFASVHPWAWSTMAVVTGALLIAWAVRHVVSGEPVPVHPRRIRVPLALFALVVAWVLLQTVPWVPEGWKHPVWDEAARALGRDLPGAVSVNPGETLEALTRLLAYAGIFWLALQHGRDPARARQGFVAVALAGLAYAGYGLVVEFTDARMVLWYPKTAYVRDLTSTFVNRNNYATYAGLGLVVTVALLIDLAGKAYSGPGIRRERARRTLARLAERGWLLAVAAVVIAMALLLSNSRGGFLSSCAGLLALLLAAARSRTLQLRRALALSAVVLLAGSAFFVLSASRVADRLVATDVAEEERLDIWRSTVQGIEDNRWLGFGYGTYSEAFRLYRDEDLTKVYVMAHSTYLELAFELGIIFAAMLVAAVGALAASCLAATARRRRDAVYPMVGVAATFLVAAHATVDFSIQIPAVAVTFAFVLGIGCAQSWSTRS